MRNSFTFYLIGAIYLSICLTIYLFIFIRNIPTDIQLHIEILELHLNKGYFPTPPLYYLFIHLIGLLFSSNPYIFSSVIVLSFISLAKYFVVSDYLKMPDSPKNILIGILTFTVMLAGPIIVPWFNNSHLYLGKFSSNIWHNSTTIFVAPISIILFIQTTSYLKKPNYCKLLLMFVTSILVAISKPSFLFPFIIAFPVISFLNFKFNQYFYASLLLSGFIGLVLFFQVKLVYKENPLDSVWYKGEKSEIIYAPLLVWKSFSNGMFRDFFVSFLFLISFVLLKFKSLLKERDLQLSILLLLGSLLVFLLFAESGPRMFHGNFYWQIPISITIVHMVMLKSIFRSFNSKSLYKSFFTFPFIYRVLLGIMFLHLLSGAAYIFRLIITKSYY